MSWTSVKCVECMMENGKCNGSCRYIPERFVSIPHALDPVAYGIDGEDDDSIIDEYINPFGKD